MIATAFHDFILAHRMEEDEEDTGFDLDDEEEDDATLPEDDDAALVDDDDLVEDDVLGLGVEEEKSVTEDGEDEDLEDFDADDEE